jgi:hypothetical protein
LPQRSLQGSLRQAVPAPGRIELNRNRRRLRRSFLRILYTPVGKICADSMQGAVSFAPFKRGSVGMDDVFMVVLIGVFFLAVWGLARFCERLSHRG